VFRQKKGVAVSATEFAAVPTVGETRETEAIWFLGTLSLVKASKESTDGRMALVEMLAPPGFGSPLHVHRREDEWFYVIEGALTVWVDGEASDVPAGSFAYGPRAVPHTFVVSSPAPARVLLGAEPSGFEDFVRELGVPARALTLAPASVELPSPERMTNVAAKYGMEILGPPGIPA
jgi:mannose-6-phosphate isomerase-like protein (cupin superfamily)